MKSKTNNGYIAVTSAIILAIIIMTVALTLGLNSLSNRLDILGVDLKKTSRALSEACANIALLKLAQNISYAGNENITVGTSACSILAVATSSAQVVIKTTANVQNYITNLKVTGASSTTPIISWEELANF